MTAKKTTTTAEIKQIHTASVPAAVAESLASEQTKPTIDQLIIKGIDAAGLGQSCAHDLGTLFRAIQQLSTKDSTIHDLAGIGKYLADDHWNTLSCERETFEEMRDGGAHHG